MGAFSTSLVLSSRLTNFQVETLFRIHGSRKLILNDVSEGAPYFSTFFARYPGIDEPPFVPISPFKQDNQHLDTFATGSTEQEKDPISAVETEWAVDYRNELQAQVRLLHIEGDPDLPATSVHRHQTCEGPGDDSRRDSDFQFTDPEDQTLLDLLDSTTNWQPDSGVESGVFSPEGLQDLFAFDLQQELFTDEEYHRIFGASDFGYVHPYR